MHMPILVTTTHPGLPLPPYSIGTPPTHLLALGHPHPTPPSPWVTPNIDFFVHTHTCAPDLDYQPPTSIKSPSTFTWGLTTTTTPVGPMLLTLHVCPNLAYTGILVHPWLRSHQKPLCSSGNAG